MVLLWRGIGIRVSHEARRAYHGAMKHAFRAGMSLALALGAAAGAVAADEPWAVAGQQGLVRFVIVPVAQSKDEPAYQRQIASLCEPDRTCFLNFYTNATGAPLAMPLPDAIANEATATFRRSTKNGAERFMWSCRMKLQEPCF
jgi:predicted component of type VI protein secretion system